MKNARPTWRSVVPVIGLGVVAFVVIGLLYELGGPPGNRVLFAALLASLGGIYGSCLALDGRSAIAVADAPLLRTILSAVFGGCVALVVWRWLPETSWLFWLATGAPAGGILGFFGWRWARHVSF